MATAWQTLEQAALTLGISSRTLHRRITRGEVVTRIESGRREVQVEVSEPAPFVAQSAAEGPINPSDASDTSATRFSSENDAESRASDRVRQLSDEPTDTVLALHEDRIRRTDLAVRAYQQSLATANAEVQKAQVRSRIAWGMAGTMVAGLFLCIVWTTHSLTKAKADTDHLDTVVRQLTDTAADKAREAADMRQRAESARVAAANAQGQLDAAKTHLESLRTELQRSTEAQQAMQALYLADAAQQSSAKSAAADNATAVSATQPAPATQPVQPILRWSDIITRPINP